MNDLPPTKIARLVGRVRSRPSVPAAAQLGGEAYPKLIHFNKLDKGGHFPAWEQPELFTQELRAA